MPILCMQEFSVKGSIQARDFVTTTSSLKWYYLSRGTMYFMYSCKGTMYFMYLCKVHVFMYFIFRNDKKCHQNVVHDITGLSHSGTWECTGLRNVSLSLLLRQTEMGLGINLISKWLALPSHINLSNSQGTKLWIIMEYLGGGSALDLVSIFVIQFRRLTAHSAWNIQFKWIQYWFQELWFQLLIRNCHTL